MALTDDYALADAAQIASAHQVWLVADAEATAARAHAAAVEAWLAAERAAAEAERVELLPPVVVTRPGWITDAQLYRLRLCESTDNYTITVIAGTQIQSRATGAYQFEQPTWDGVASRHAPHLVGVKPAHAAPADQDQMARWLWSERGRQPWPVCGLRV